jgi:hypothetical protein
VTDDIDFFEQVQALPLCEHVAGVYVDTGGWSLDADPASPYHGTWVHAHPKCMKPRYLETAA